MVWMAIAIALPMTFLSDWLVNLLYGEQYNQSGSVHMIHIWTGVFVFLGVASGKWFIAENLQMLSFWRTFYGMTINVILNFLFIISEQAELKNRYLWIMIGFIPFIYFLIVFLS